MLFIIFYLLFFSIFCFIIIVVLFQEAKCTDSHILSPMSNRVAFATLGDRPSAYDFERSPILQDWVTATDVRIVFNRLSPDEAELYGVDDGTIEVNEINDDVQYEDNATISTLVDSIEQRYFYALAELAVGGRCRCNGHASRCIFDKFGRYACDCKHNTYGIDCEKCKPHSSIYATEYS